MNDAATYIHKFKCMGCGLHYTVYSFEPDWADDHTNYCPECGATEGKLHWVEPSQQFIFQYVPGDAVMVSMGGPA